ncbi:unnamed protein product [Rhodiola kirilowii]
MDLNPMMFKVKRLLRMLSRPRLKDWFGWFLVIVMVALVLSAVVITFGNGLFGYEPEPVPGPPGEIDPRYAEALKLGMMFFDIQKSGKLENNKIPWRGDSGLKDGSEANLDLSKGMYDAGDHIKFGFPLAFTATILSWGILEYGDRMQAVDQLDSAKGSLKWITDYLIVAHASKNVLYIQVGDAYKDHKCWDRPENMSDYRPLIQINASKPGTEVAAETAAALASASIVFKKTDSAYSDELLLHAKQLFRFANRYRGSYTVSIPQLGSYYKSSGYGDELLWAASWLYHATGDEFYLELATGDFGEAFANWGNPSWFCWDDKLAGTQVLLSRVSLLGNHKSNPEGLHNYRKTAEAVMCNLLPSSPSATNSRTPGGLIWVNEWNNLQHSIGSAFLAAVYSDYMLSSRTARLNCNGVLHKPSDLRNFAISQMEYVLGDNPMNMSYLVGYGDNYPGYVHHRGGSIPADSPDCTCANGWKWLLSTKRDPNIAYGALVGGPFLNDSYIDSRNNSMQAEPTTYNNAVLVGLLSSLVTTSSVVSSFN